MIKQKRVMKREKKEKTIEEKYPVKDIRNFLGKGVSTEKFH